MYDLHKLLRNLNNIRDACFTIRGSEDPQADKKIVAEVSADSVEFFIREAPNAVIPLFEWKRSYYGDEDKVSLLSSLSDVCAGYMHIALSAVQEQRDRDAEQAQKPDRVEMRGHLDLRSSKAIAEVMIDFVDECGGNIHDRKIELIKRIRRLESNVYKEG